MAGQRQKFSIGDIVYNKVSTRGSYEPSMCDPNTRLKIEGVQKRGDTFLYTCDYDGYIFKEDELMSVQEYKDSL